MQGVFKMIERVADTDSTILILGESGTGKELVARALHFNSRRQFAPFIPVNCSALPENLLESELFGHRKGSFTGAINDKKGLFQEADGGTIFLDEIGSMSAVLQSRLLRVLAGTGGPPVSATTSPPTSTSACSPRPTSRWKKKSRTARFARTFITGLTSLPSICPACANAARTFPLLVAHFLRNKINPRTGKLVQITRQAMDVLAAHDWPGNVRELENAIERACTLCENNIIQAADLPPILAQKAAQPPGPGDIAQLPAPAPQTSALFPLNNSTPAAGAGTPNAGTPAANASLKDYLREQELSYLNRVLAEVGGDKEKAALNLGISLATLYRKLSEDERAA